MIYIPIPYKHLQLKMYITEKNLKKLPNDNLPAYFYERCIWTILMENMFQSEHIEVKNKHASE